MLDTVTLNSTPVTDETARKVERFLIRRSGVNVGSGEVLYEITAGPIRGTWDSRISVRVRRDRMVYDPDEGRPVPVPCPPFLTVEGSVHKAMLGHNVYGGPEDLTAPCEWLLDDLGGRLGVQLLGGLDAPLWIFRRIDWAEVYELPYEACERYIHNLNSAHFPRRKCLRYGDEAWFAPGSTTALKIYHKGPEFAVHDRNRLREYLDGDELDALQSVANDLLRVEVGIKARMLDQEYETPFLGTVATTWVKDRHRREIGRLVREGNSQMETVRKQRSVRDRLGHVYFSNPRLQGLLFGTWLQLSALGYKATKSNMSERTFYRHLSMLRSAGIAWENGDVVHVPQLTSLPENFRPFPSDPHHVGGEDPAVNTRLARFRAA